MLLLVLGGGALAVYRAVVGYRELPTSGWFLACSLATGVTAVLMFAAVSVLKHKKSPPRDAGEFIGPFGFWFLVVIGVVPNLFPEILTDVFYFDSAGENRAVRNQAQAMIWLGMLLASALVALASRKLRPASTNSLGSDPNSEH